MPKSTLLRLLSTLRSHNFVKQDGETKRFSLGLGLVALGKAAEKNFNLAQEVHPFLVELAEKTGETASLSTLEGDHAVYIDQVVSKSMIRGQPRIGLTIGLHCSSGGKMLLSGLPDERIEEFFTRNHLTKKTEKTITDPQRLRKEVQKIREQGYATDDEEVEEGGRCVAAPLRDKHGRIIAAISVMGPTTRIRQKDFPRLAEVVKEEVMKASESLGYMEKTP
jgi:DNA-binding IclR family transcriptional regulator